MSADNAGAKKILAAVLAGAAVLRLAYLAELSRSPFYSTLLLDLASYDAWAQRIAGGEWLGSRVYYQDPLYPYFLGTLYALFGRRLLLVYLLQIAIGVATCYLVYRLAKRFFGARAGLCAAGLAALYKPFVFYDVQVEKTFLAVFVISAAAWLFVRALDTGGAGTLLMAGAVLGLAVLLRGNYVLLLPLLALGIAAGSPTGLGLRRAALYVCGTTALLGATAARNYLVAGDLVLTTSQAGQNLYIGNNEANLTGMYRAPEFVRADPKYEEADFAREAVRRAGRPLRPSEVSSFWSAEARRFIFGRPADFLRLLGLKAALFWNGYEIPDNLDQYFMERYSLVLKLWLPGFGLVAPLAAAGAVLEWRRRREAWVLYAFVVVYFVSVVLFYVFARYRLPVVPFLMAFAGCALDRAAAVSRAGVLRLVPAAATFVAALALVNAPLVGAYNAAALTNLGAVLLGTGETAAATEVLQEVALRRPDYADARNNLGVALLRKGEAAQALEQLRAATRLAPLKPGAWVNLAEALARSGDRAGAARALDRALETDPRSADAWAGLGGRRREGGDLRGAVEAFRTAVELDPESASHANNLGVALVGAGRLEEALAQFGSALSLAPEFGEAHFNRGVCLERLGRRQEAIAAYRRAVELRPDDARAWGNMGNLLAEAGDRDGAVRAYARFLEVFKGDEAIRNQVRQEMERLR